MTSASDTSSVHEAIAERLYKCNQRYGNSRKLLIDALMGAGRPLTAAELGDHINQAVPYSSLYRNLTQLAQAGVIRRLVSNDDQGRFEVSEDLLGAHHHHLTCLNCGRVTDITAATRLERALTEATTVAKDDFGFEVTEHRIDLFGYCKACRRNKK